MSMMTQNAGTVKNQPSGIPFFYILTTFNSYFVKNTTSMRALVSISMHVAEHTGCNPGFNKVKGSFLVDLNGLRFHLGCLTNESQHVRVWMGLVPGGEEAVLPH